MNIPVLKKTLLALVLASIAGSSVAADSVINVSGTLTTQSCTIAAADVNKAVSLPTVGSNNLLNAANLQPVTFSFGISGCDTSLTKATATIAGTQASSDVTGYGTNAVIANTGTATNVGIGFLGATSVGTTPAGVLPVGTASAVAPLTQASGATSSSGTLYLAAQVVPLVKASATGAGSVAGTATVTFTYS